MKKRRCYMRAATLTRVFMGVSPRKCRHHRLRGEGIQQVRGVRTTAVRAADRNIPTESGAIAADEPVVRSRNTQ